MIVNNFELSANFWKLNPQLIIPEVFNALYKGDKSKDKQDSSKIMWAIALLLEPESKFYNLPVTERREIISKDYLKIDKFKWDSIDKEVKFYERMILTPAQRQLSEWNRLMDEKNEYMRTLKYNSDTAELIEKLLISNGKLFIEYERLSELLQKEGDVGLVKGGVVESLGERGEI